MSLADFPALLERIEQGTAASGDVPALERLAEAAPGHVTAYVALARAFELNARWSDAHRSWQRAYLLLPGSPAVRAGLQRTAHHTARRAAPQPSQQPEEREEAAHEQPAGQAEASPRTQMGEKHAEEEQRRPPGSPALQELAASLPAQADDDLDSLIADLEGARIEPNPDPEDVPAPDLDTDDRDVVSPTLARIYEAQGQYAEAARVHRRLAEERPAEAEEHRRQAEALDARAEQEARERGGGGESG